MLGSNHLHYNPAFLDDLNTALLHKQDTGRSRHLGNKSSKSSKFSNVDKDCSPSDIDLNDFPQWQQEKGYWIGSYTFLNGDGEAHTSSSWNYPYANYKGFITGEVSG